MGMFGQLCRPDGAVELPDRAVELPLCDAGAEWVVLVVDVLEVAALAIAAPPPTRAPVTKRVVSNDFSLTIGEITSFLLSGMGATIPSERRTRVGGE